MAFTTTNTFSSKVCLNTFCYCSSAIGRDLQPFWWVRVLLFIMSLTCCLSGPVRTALLIWIFHANRKWWNEKPIGWSKCFFGKSRWSSRRRRSCWFAGGCKSSAGNSAQVCTFSWSKIVSFACLNNSFRWKPFFAFNQVSLSLNQVSTLLSIYLWFPTDVLIEWGGWNILPAFSASDFSLRPVLCFLSTDVWSLYVQNTGNILLRWTNGCKTYAYSNIILSFPALLR